MLNENEKHPDSELIDKLGGTSKAALFFEVAPASVSEWRRTGLPKARMMYVRAVRPDLFETKKNRRSGVERRNSFHPSK